MFGRAGPDDFRRAGPENFRRAGPEDPPEVFIVRSLFLAAACVAAAAVSTQTSTPPVTSIAVSQRSAANASIAARGPLVVVAFSASAGSGETDVFVAVSHDGGRTFGAPSRVNDLPGDARVNGEQPPRVALRDQRIIVVWTSKGPKGTRLLQAQSDDGRTFTRAALVPGSDAAGNRGWENADATYAVWLDHRELAQDESTMTTMHHEHASASKPDGVAMAQKSKLFFASLDGTLAPHAVTGGVCYCCKTALAESADGSIYLAWRHVYPGNFRDIAFTLSRDGGKTFAPPLRVSEDKWMLEGCPDDGPAMAIDAQRRVHLVWPTLVAGDAGGEPSVGLFYATSADGRAFTPRERVPTQAVAHHPQIVIGADGAPVMAWDESQNGTRRIVVARRRAADAGAKAGGTIARDVIADAGVYPALAVAGETTVVAWTSGKTDSTIAVRRLER